MPVIGTGIDLVFVPGFAEQWRLPGTKIAEIFTSRELADCHSETGELKLESLAARWAAKEAFVKAWSESLWGSAPVAGEHVHHLIEVVKDAWNRPRIVLLGELTAALAEVEIYVSLSHDGEYATAMVTLASRA